MPGQDLHSDRQSRGRNAARNAHAWYAGQVAGPLLGGFVGGHFGMRAVFLATALLMALGAIYNFFVRARYQRTGSVKQAAS